MAKYNCDVCDYHTDHKSNYNRHMTSKTHMKNQPNYVEEKKEKEFHCEVCSKDYSSKVTFQRHLKSKLHELNSQRVNEVSKVERDGEQVYKCNLCKSKVNYYYSQYKSNVTRHVNEVHKNLITIEKGKKKVVEKQRERVSKFDKLEKDLKHAKKQYKIKLEYEEILLGDIEKQEKVVQNTEESDRDYGSRLRTLKDLQNDLSTNKMQTRAWKKEIKSLEKEIKSEQEKKKRTRKVTEKEEVEEVEEPKKKRVKGKNGFLYTEELEKFKSIYKTDDIFDSEGVDRYDMEYQNRYNKKDSSYFKHLIVSILNLFDENDILKLTGLFMGKDDERYYKAQKSGNKDREMEVLLDITESLVANADRYLRSKK